MNDHTFELIEVTGTSSNSIEEAIQNGIARVGKDHNEMRWFAVTEIRGAVQNGKASQWQVTLKIGSRLE